MKIELWVYVQGGGDGSASAHFFTSERDAVAYANRDFRVYGETFTEPPKKETLEVNEQGRLLNPSLLGDIEELMAESDYRPIAPDIEKELTAGPWCVSGQ